jgi:hypothetical protein
MFGLIASSVLALAASVSAGPIAPRTSISSGSHQLSPFSFNNWGGFSSMSNFDNFFGSDNFCGESQSTTVLSQTVVCQSESVSTIQQQLSIMLEFAKRIITEQICEVEVQTITWSQFSSRVSSFSSDLSRSSGRSIGYDHSIASHIDHLVNSDGSIVTSDYGFQGTDIGSNLIHVSGSNWVTGSSESSVQQAILASQVATSSSHSKFTSGSTFGSSGNSFSPSGSAFAVGSL